MRKDLEFDQVNQGQKGFIHKQETNHKHHKKALTEQIPVKNGLEFKMCLQ